MPPSPLSPSPRPQGTQPHYQLGDLGLIPRPAQNILSSVDKMKESATASRLGGLKKVLTKSVATQTISAPKVSLTSCNLCNISSNIQKIICDHSENLIPTYLIFRRCSLLINFLVGCPTILKYCMTLMPVKEITR